MHTSGFPEMGRCALKSKLEFHFTSGVGSRSVQSSSPREEEIKLQTSASFPRISVLDPFHLPLIVTPQGSDRARSFPGDLGASGVSPLDKYGSSFVTGQTQRHQADSCSVDEKVRWILLFVDLLAVF